MTWGISSSNIMSPSYPSYRMTYYYMFFFSVYRKSCVSQRSRNATERVNRRDSPVNTFTPRRHHRLRHVCRRGVLSPGLRVLRLPLSLITSNERRTTRRGTRRSDEPVPPIFGAACLLSSSNDVEEEAPHDVRIEAADIGVRVPRRQTTVSGQAFKSLCLSK